MFGRPAETGTYLPFFKCTNPTTSLGSGGGFSLKINYRLFMFVLFFCFVIYINVEGNLVKALLNKTGSDIGKSTRILR